MKPLVIIGNYNVCLMGVVKTYNVIYKETDKVKESTCSEKKAYDTIKKYSLPLAYKDEFGSIYADPEDNPYKKIKSSYINSLPKKTKDELAAREKLMERQFWVIEEMGECHGLKKEILNEKIRKQELVKGILELENNIYSREYLSGLQNYELEQIYRKLKPDYIPPEEPEEYEEESDMG